MPPILNRLWRHVRATVAPVPDISADLWLQTLQRYPFLAALSLHEQSKLRALSALFLDQKQFHGAHGLVITDRMALTIADFRRIAEFPRGVAIGLGNLLLISPLLAFLLAATVPLVADATELPGGLVAEVLSRVGVPRLVQRGERRDGESRRSHEDDAHKRWA